MPNTETRRSIEIVVLSDVHLGTYGCHARELVTYLRSIQPKTLVLNGDIIDIWQFKKSYFPKSHMKVIREIIRLASKGTEVHYITGNHDESLRRFTGFNIGNLHLSNKLLLEIDGKKAWIFHGDVFDVTMQHARWLTKLGSIGYDLLILINSFCNWLLTTFGRDKISLSKRIKNSVKRAVSYINSFEDICADIAIRNQYDYVLCGHIHHPEIKQMENKNGSVLYLNSGDWIENLTALEYSDKQWKIHQQPLESGKKKKTDDEELMLDKKHLFNQVMNEIYELQPV